MKNHRFYTIALIAAFALTGCGDIAPAESSQAETTSASTQETTEAVTEATTEVSTEAETQAEESTEADVSEPEAEEPDEASDYKSAYLAFIESAENSSELYYNLIYIDNDDIPELVTGYDGYWVSMYTYADGEIYTLMDHWGYGVMGNTGYQYAPKLNSIRNYNTDYAGLILWTAYASNTDNSELEWSTVIETYYFDDKNGNDIPDEDEPYSEKACKNLLYIDDDTVEITSDEALSYNVGEYQYIIPEMTLDEIKAELS